MSVELITYSQLLNCKHLTIPEGNVKKITSNGQPIWYDYSNFNGYQPVEWICAAKDVAAYIDLGFAFDTAATIYIEQWLDNAPQWLTSNEETYVFGAADSTGVYRCMLTSPGNQYGSFTYGSNGSTYLNVFTKCFYAGKNRIQITQKAGACYFENLDTGEVSNNQTTNIAFTMTDNLYLFAQNYKGVARFNKSLGHERKIGRFSYYDKDDTLICDLYPCYHKFTGVIGMYDRVRNIFLTNIGTGSFTKGDDCLPYTNLADPISADWKNGYRLSSSSDTGVTTFSGTTTTNFINIKKGDIIRLYGATFVEGNNGNRIGVKVTTAAGAESTPNTNFPNNAVLGGITVISYEGLANGVYTFKVHGDYETAGGQIHAIRFSFQTPTNADDVIITVNEEITEHRLTTNTITFNIGSTKYQAEEDMTWAEWCDSEYNIDGYIVNENDIQHSENLMLVYQTTYVDSDSSFDMAVSPTDTIIANTLYFLDEA